MLVETSSVLRSGRFQRPDQINGDIFGSATTQENASRNERTKAPPGVLLSFNPSDKIEGPWILRADNEPTLLPIEGMEGEVMLPERSFVYFKCNGYAVLLKDHTTNPEKGQGVRGVTISHGGVLSHEFKPWSYGRDGSVNRGYNHVYLMPAGEKGFL